MIIDFGNYLFNCTIMKDDFHGTNYKIYITSHMKKNVIKRLRVLLHKQARQNVLPTRINFAGVIF